MAHGKVYIPPLIGNMGLFSKKKKNIPLNAHMSTAQRAVSLWAKEMNVPCKDDGDHLCLTIDDWKINCFFDLTEDYVEVSIVSTLTYDKDSISPGNEWLVYQDLLKEISEYLHHPFAMDRDENGEIRLYFMNVLTFDDIAPLSKIQDEIIDTYLDVKNLSEAIDKLFG